MRILALMEARTVTGPAKNLIRFALHARANISPEIQLRVVTFDRPSAPVTEFLSGLHDAGIPYDLISEKHRGDLGVVRRLGTLLAAQKPDIVQTHNSKSHVLLRLLRQTGGPKWIAFHHGFTSTNVADRVQNVAARWALRAAPQVVTVCNAFAEELQAAGIPRSRIAVVPNSVASFQAPPAADLTALREQLALANGTRVLVTVGRLSREKGHADLVTALHILQTRNRGMQVRALVIGDGPERSALERQAAGLGIAQGVVFLGHQPDVRPYYAIADAVALPSHSEGSSNVLLEAMAAGLPIVATAVGGSVELLQNETNALFAPAHNPSAFANALERVLENDALAKELGANARVRSLAFGAAQYVERLMTIYTRVLTT